MTGSEADMHVRRLRRTCDAWLAGIVIGLVLSGGCANPRAAAVVTGAELRVTAQLLAGRDIPDELPQRGELKHLLEVAGLEARPSRDGWGRPLLYERGEHDCILLRSLGSDGQVDSGPFVADAGYATDIVAKACASGFYGGIQHHGGRIWWADDPAAGPKPTKGELVGERI